MKWFESNGFLHEYEFILLYLQKSLEPRVELSRLLGKALESWVELIQFWDAYLPTLVVIWIKHYFYRLWATIYMDAALRVHMNMNKNKPIHSNGKSQS